MKPFTIFASLLIPLGAQTATGAAQAAEEDVRCEIRTESTSQGIHLAGVVVSSVAIGGTYEFEVEKSGGGGTANSAQSGTFSVEAGGTSTLGEVSLGLGGSEVRYTARLTVEWDGGQTSCRIDYPERS